MHITDQPHKSVTHVAQARDKGKMCHEYFHFIHAIYHLKLTFLYKITVYFQSWTYSIILTLNLVVRLEKVQDPRETSSRLIGTQKASIYTVWAEATYKCQTVFLTPQSPCYQIPSKCSPCQAQPSGSQSL